jgi:hypothetical protein
LYQRRFAGHLAPSGAGAQPRRWLWALGDGFWARLGFKPLPKHSRYRTARVRNAGYAQFRLLSPRLEPFWPSAWAVLRFLYIRHRKGRRFRLGLPARGQRTHSNAATTRRIRNVVISYIKARYWTKRLWEARKRKATTSRPKSKQLKRSSKADKPKQGVVRSKKNKKDVWR